VIVNFSTSFSTEAASITLATWLEVVEVVVAVEPAKETESCWCLSLLLPNVRFNSKILLRLSVEERWIKELERRVFRMPSVSFPESSLDRPSCCRGAVEVIGATVVLVVFEEKPRSNGGVLVVDESVDLEGKGSALEVVVVAIDADTALGSGPHIIIRSSSSGFKRSKTAGG
jgi:hypothetical protein